jgi:hypothetical protein
MKKPRAMAMTAAPIRVSTIELFIAQSPVCVRDD